MPSSRCVENHVQSRRKIFMTEWKKLLYFTRFNVAMFFSRRSVNVYTTKRNQSPGLRISFHVNSTSLVVLGGSDASFIGSLVLQTSRTAISHAVRKTLRLWKGLPSTDARL